MADARILIVGAGFSGAVMARELAEKSSAKILVIDARDHVAGNCHTARDPATGVMVHKYGAHIFHTSREDVWNYVRRFSEFGAYRHRVRASNKHGNFGLPINLTTINQFFGKSFTPEQAEAFVATQADPSIGEPCNFEEQALKFIGRDLYEAFFYGYTKKQWGCEPRELPASLLKRLPVRFNADDSYFSDRFEGIPIDGYTEIVERMLAHKNIEVKLSTPWTPAMSGDFDHVIFTGPLDAFYQHRYGRLGYRTVSWEESRHAGDFQGTTVINYTGLEVACTRIVEHKHFAPWEQHAQTVVFTEYSKETTEADEPFYPKRLAEDKGVLEKYLALAKAEAKVSFLGRLATYRYLDMHQVIAEALDFAPGLIEALRSGVTRPSLPVVSP